MTDCIIILDGLTMGSTLAHHFQTYGCQSRNPIFEMMSNILKDKWIMFLEPLSSNYSVPAYGNKCIASQLKFTILDLCINHLKS